MGAREHEKFRSFVLSVFQKTLSNIVCIVADNSPTNKALSDLLGCVFIGFHSHRYNLAMNNFLSEYDGLLSTAHYLMIKF